MSRSSKPTHPKPVKLALIHLALLFSISATAIVGKLYLNLNPKCDITFLCGVMFLLASFRTPEIFYQVIRSAGWFSLIEDDRAMCCILAVLGTVLALGGGLCLVV